MHDEPTTSREHLMGAGPGSLVEQRSVLILGAGYVGTSLAESCTKAGMQVTAFDTSERALASIGSEVGCAVISHPRELGQAPDVCILAVNTPTIGHDPDYGPLIAACRAVAQVIRPGTLVINESTVGTGATRSVVSREIEAGCGLSPDRDYLLAYSPERIDPGNSRYRLETTPKLVAGATDAAAQAAVSFYADFVDDVQIVDSIEELEFTKLFENSFRAVGIALANEMALAATNLGLSPRTVFRAAATKPFGYLPFSPGAGVGGDCIPTDPWYLLSALRESGCGDFTVLQAALSVNERMPERVVARTGQLLTELGGSLLTSRIVVLGLGYKPNQAALTNSPGLEVCRLLRERGAQLAAYDPLVEPGSSSALEQIRLLQRQELSEWNPTVGIVCALHDCLRPLAQDTWFPLVDPTATMAGPLVHHV
jgi:UDP-N-acetyl-D-glucosamine dehydrogenase